MDGTAGNEMVLGIRISVMIVEEKPKRLKNGMIALIHGMIGSGHDCKKWLDIEIMNYFPLIALSQKTSLYLPDGSNEDISAFDHLSIPSDLRLHLSNKEEHVFFDAGPAKNFIESKAHGPLHLFTFIGPQIDAAPQLLRKQNNSWNGAVLISPFKDQYCSQYTHAFIDFFLHHETFAKKAIIEFPFCFPNMRLSFDRSGCTLDSFLFESLQRKGSDFNILFTIRYGFIELENESTQAQKLYVNSSIYERRKRS